MSDNRYYVKYAWTQSIRPSRRPSAGRNEKPPAGPSGWHRKPASEAQAEPLFCYAMPFPVGPLRFDQEPAVDQRPFRLRRSLRRDRIAQDVGWRHKAGVTVGAGTVRAGNGINPTGTLSKIISVTVNDETRLRAGRNLGRQGRKLHVLGQIGVPIIEMQIGLLVAEKYANLSVSVRRVRDQRHFRGARHAHGFAARPLDGRVHDHRNNLRIEPLIRPR